MIYLVSNSIDVTGIEGVEAMDLNSSLDIIAHWSVVQFDTETTGLDPHVCKMTSMQFGYHHFDTGEHTEIVVDCNSIDPKEYREVIERSYLIGHNLAFDLKFLYNYDIVPLKVYDTMVCEQLLYLGYKPGSVSMKLSDVLLRRVGVELDKSFQKEIATKGLTPEGIVYAAHDVVYLQHIRRAQMEVAKDRKCLNAMTVENRFVPAIAYLEWCGIHLDEQRWKEKMKRDATELAEYKHKLDEYVSTHTKLSSKFVSTYTQPSLFDTDGSSYKPECLVDWNSAKQVVPVLQELGFNTKTKDKKTKEEKDTALEKLIVTQKGIADDFLYLYFGYKGAEKNVSSYGQGHLNLINPNTGRLHTAFHQFGTVTGRMSSGSKAKNRDLAQLKGLFPEDVGFVNLQNLPARGDAGKECRACFTATEGNVFVSCDYSAEESRVSADVWNETSLLDAFENNIDTHNLYAKMCFPEELKDIDVRDVKKERPDLRQAAKSAEFAVNYGSNGASIATTIGMSVDKAMSMVQGILKGMPGMAEYKKKTGKFLRDNGYIVINPITGHRVYWPEWASWKAREDSFDRQFWEDYKLYHKGTDDEVAQMVRKHMSQGHDWFEKNVLNYPIQGGSAIVLKQAAGDLFEWVVNNGYFNKILFCCFVHDEIDVECPKELSDMFAKKLESIMEKAASKFYKRLPIPAECAVNSYWEH
jgi:DNA polymerase-1